MAESEPTDDIHLQIHRCVDTSTDLIKGRKILSHLQSSDQKGGILSTSESFMEPGVDRRKIVKDFSADCFASMVKLLVKINGNEYHGSGQMVNLRLGPLKVSKIFIQTCGHNLALRDDFNKKTIHFAESCTAYLKMTGEEEYSHALPVENFAIYPKYLKDLTAANNSGFDYAIGAIDISPDKILMNAAWDCKFNTVPSLLSKLGDKGEGCQIRVSGYGEKKDKCFRPHYMDGTISEIHMAADKEHGVIIYHDVDTSCGQSGGMIMLTEECSKLIEIADLDLSQVSAYPIPSNVQGARIRGTIIGVHTGGRAGVVPKNWGTLITPAIMKWTRDVVTSGTFWKGDYTCSSVNPIGSEGIIFTPEIMRCLQDLQRKKVDKAFVRDVDDFRIVLIGSMGCGKSTFTKALCGNNTAVAGIDQNGVTRAISAYYAKEEICARLGVKTACIIDVPGTGDPTVPIATLIAQLEASLEAAKVHAIVLMNCASEARINVGVRVATKLLEKSFIESADQIIGVMTQADLVPKKRCAKTQENWRKILKEAFDVEIPVVMCAIPVMDDEPYNVLEPHQFKEYDIDWDPEGPSCDETIVELARLAKNPKIAKYVRAHADIIADVAALMGVDITDMQKQIQMLNEHREQAKQAQKEFQEKLQAMHAEQLRNLHVKTEERSLRSRITEEVQVNWEEIVFASTDVSDCIQRMKTRIMQLAEALVGTNEYVKSVPIDLVKEVQRLFEPRFKREYENYIKQKVDHIEIAITNDMKDLHMHSIVKQSSRDEQFCKFLIQQKVKDMVGSRFQEESDGCKRYIDKTIQNIEARVQQAFLTEFHRTYRLYHDLKHAASPIEHLPHPVRSEKPWENIECLRFDVLQSDPLILCENRDDGLWQFDAVKSGSIVPAALDFSAEEGVISKAINQCSINFEWDISILTRKAMFKLKSHILHLSGYGEEGTLIIEDGFGGTLFYGEETLENMNLTELNPNLRIVFISMCHSESIAKKFVDMGVLHVIAVGNAEKVKDKVAIEFTEMFYTYLFQNGLSLANAFKGAVEYIDNQGKDCPMKLLPILGKHDRTLTEIFGKSVYSEEQRHLKRSRSNPEVVISAVPNRDFNEYTNHVTIWKAVNELHTSRLLAIHGPAYVGRESVTAFTAHYSKRLSHFPDGILVVSFTGRIESKQEFFDRIASTINAVYKAGVGPDFDSIQYFISTKRIALFFTIDRVAEEDFLPENIDLKRCIIDMITRLCNNTSEAAFCLCISQENYDIARERPFFFQHHTHVQCSFMDAGNAREYLLRKLLQDDQKQLQNSKFLEKGSRLPLTPVIIKGLRNLIYREKIPIRVLEHVLKTEREKWKLDLTPRFEADLIKAIEDWYDRVELLRPFWKKHIKKMQGKQSSSGVYFEEDEKSEEDVLSKDDQEDLKHATSPIERRPHPVRSEAGATIIETTAKVSQPIHLHYLTYYPVRAMFNCDEIQFEDFSFERRIIKEVAEDSSFDVNMCQSVCTWESFLENAHILHIAGEGVSGWITFENSRGGKEQIQLSGNPIEDAHKILRHFTYELLSVQRKADRTKLVLYFKCYSEPCGRAMVALGFEHVICIRKDQEVNTTACEKFARCFYKHLFSLHTIQEAFTAAVESLAGFDKVFMLLPEDRSHDYNIQQLTGIAPLTKKENSTIQIQDPTFKVPKGGDVGKVPAPKELHISVDVAFNIIFDLNAHGFAIVHGPMISAREQMAQIIACQVFRLRHFPNGVYAIKFAEPIVSKRDFIEQTVDCIHQANPDKELSIKVDDDGKSLIKHLKRHSICLLFYSDSRFTQEADWIGAHKRIRFQIYKFLIELHDASIEAMDSTKGAIFVSLTGESYKEFRQVCETCKCPLSNYLKMQDHQDLQDLYLIDYVETNNDKQGHMEGQLADYGFDDAAIRQIVPYTTNIIRRLNQFKKDYEREAVLTILGLFLENRSIHPDHKEAAFDLHHFSSAMDVRDELLQYQAELLPNYQKPSSDDEFSGVFSSDTGINDIQWQWTMEFLTQHTPRVLSEKAFVVNAFNEAFRNEEPTMFTSFLENNEDEIKDRWLWSDDGRNRLLELLNDKVRSNPKKFEVRSRRTIWDVGEKFEELYGIPDHEVVVYLKNPCSALAEGMQAVKKGTWSSHERFDRPVEDDDHDFNKEEVVQWMTDLALRNSPNIFWSREIEQKCVEAFPEHDREALTSFFEIEGIEKATKRWLESDIGMNKMLKALDDKVRRDPVRNKVTSRRVREEVGEEYGIDEDLVGYFFRNQPPEFTHALRRIQDRTWLSDIAIAENESLKDRKLNNTKQSIPQEKDAMSTQKAQDLQSHIRSSITLINKYDIVQKKVLPRNDGSMPTKDSQDRSQLLQIQKQSALEDIREDFLDLNRMSPILARELVTEFPVLVALIPPSSNAIQPSINSSVVYVVKDEKSEEELFSQDDQESSCECLGRVSENDDGVFSEEKLVQWLTKLVLKSSPNIFWSDESNVLQQFVKAFPQHDREALTSFFEAEGVEEATKRWLQSDVGMNKILKALNEKVRRDPVRNKVTNRRLREQVGEECGISDELIGYFFRNQTPELARTLCKIQDGTWTAPNVERCRDSLDE